MTATTTERNERGILFAGLHADFDTPDWLKRAVAVIDSYPPDARFLTEDLRLQAYRQGLPRPPSERAWGMVIRQALREGRIQRVGQRYSLLTRRMAPIWQRREVSA